MTFSSVVASNSNRKMKFWSIVQQGKMHMQHKSAVPIVAMLTRGRGNILVGE